MDQEVLAGVRFLLKSVPVSYGPNPGFNPFRDVSGKFAPGPHKKRSPLEQAAAPKTPKKNLANIFAEGRKVLRDVRDGKATPDDAIQWAERQEKATGVDLATMSVRSDAAFYKKALPLKDVRSLQAKIEGRGFVLITRSVRGDNPPDEPMQVTSFSEKMEPLGHFYARDVLTGLEESVRGTKWDVVRVEHK